MPSFLDGWVKDSPDDFGRAIRWAKAELEAGRQTPQSLTCLEKDYWSKGIMVAVREWIAKQ